MAVMVCRYNHAFKEFAQKIVAACVSGKMPVLYEQLDFAPFYVTLASVYQEHVRWSTPSGPSRVYGHTTYEVLVPLLELALDCPAYGLRIPRGTLVPPHNDIRCSYVEPYTESLCSVNVYPMKLRPGDVFYTIKSSTWTHKNTTAAYVIDGDGVIRRIPAPHTLRVEQPVRMAA